MSKGHPRRYWDACCFTALISNEPGRAENCRRLLDEAARGEHIVVTAAITLTEVTRRSGEIQYEHREKIESFFENDYIQIVDVDRFVAQMARDFVWKLRLKGNDAIHLAAAIRGHATLMYTYDHDFLNLNDPIPFLHILEPVWTGQGELPQMPPVGRNRRS